MQSSFIARYEQIEGGSRERIIETLLPESVANRVAQRGDAYPAPRRYYLPPTPRRDYLAYANSFRYHGTRQRYLNRELDPAALRSGQIEAANLSTKCGDTFGLLSRSEFLATSCFLGDISHG